MEAAVVFCCRCLCSQHRVSTAFTPEISGVMLPYKAAGLRLQGCKTQGCLDQGEDYHPALPLPCLHRLALLCPTWTDLRHAASNQPVAILHSAPEDAQVGPRRWHPHHVFPPPRTRNIHEETGRECVQPQSWNQRQQHTNHPSPAFTGQRSRRQALCESSHARGRPGGT